MKIEIEIFKKAITGAILVFVSIAIISAIFWVSLLAYQARGQQVAEGLQGIAKVIVMLGIAFLGSFLGSWLTFRRVKEEQRVAAFLITFTLILTLSYALGAIFPMKAPVEGVFFEPLLHLVIFIGLLVGFLISKNMLRSSVDMRAPKETLSSAKRNS